MEWAVEGAVEGTVGDCGGGCGWDWVGSCEVAKINDL